MLSPTAVSRTRKRDSVIAGDPKLRHPNGQLALTAATAKLWNTFPGQAVESLEFEILKEGSVAGNRAGIEEGWRCRG